MTRPLRFQELFLLVPDDVFNGQHRGVFPETVRPFREYRLTVKPLFRRHRLTRYIQMVNGGTIIMIFDRREDAK